MRVRLEWNPADLWVGLYVTRKPEDGRTHVWVCLVPCFPLHLVFGADRRLLRSAPVRTRGTRPVVHIH